MTSGWTQKGRTQKGRGAHCAPRPSGEARAAPGGGARRGPESGGYYCTPCPPVSVFMMAPS